MGDKHPLLKGKEWLGIFELLLFPLCLGECLLLASLWIRSYFREDALCWGTTDKSGFMVFSVRGKLLASYISDIGSEVNISKWFVASYPPGETFWLPREELESIRLGCVFRSYRNGSFFMAMPHWVLVLLVWHFWPGSPLNGSGDSASGHC